MDFAERVRFCRTELEKARRDFPAASTEVQTAENLYVRALNDATCGGSPVVTGSDLSLTDDSKIHVAFYCDKVNVTAVFYVGEDRVGQRGQRAGVSLPFDELEDLASARVRAEDPRRFESRALEIAQQGVHRGRPWSRATTDRVADAHRVIEIPAERSLFEHGPSLRR